MTRMVKEDGMREEDRRDEEEAQKVTRIESSSQRVVAVASIAQAVRVEGSSREGSTDSRT